MKPINRRTFLAGGAAAGVLTGLDLPAALRGEATTSHKSAGGVEGDTPVDFRYAPADFQSTICFPDDPDKTVLGKRGDLRYDFPSSPFAGIGEFRTVVEFSLAGMGRDEWLEQRMEAPGVPIVHTRLKRAAASFELTAFATRREGEGRVDNVLMEIRPKASEVLVAPMVRIGSCDKYKMGESSGKVINVVKGDGDTPATPAIPAIPWMSCIPLNAFASTGDLFWRGDEAGYELYLEHGTAKADAPLRYLFRIAQKGARRMQTDVSPEELLREVREYWRNWRAFGDVVDWAVPGDKGDFLVACARNIQQAREMKDGMLVFEVGPTVYRGMWIVDGNFLLEAARYLGYDEDADKGLLSEWTHQVASGQIIASAGKEHYKDTAIAMFTLVRACELKQDWGMLRQLAPKVGHAIEFLIALREEARKGNSPNGKYGILPPGFADGGIGGIHYEFTNTLWALAGLRAVARANESLKIADLSRAAGFYAEMKAALDNAARDEMVADPRGFRYLPMLMREDPAMHEDAWDRPRPQSAQWALSQTIFPGEVFPTDDPIVRGHVALMQACTQEDVPAETGWLHHGGLWTYNAAFVAEVYLWAGLRDWAHRTFTGYLNHASPLHAWREEQPLQASLLGMLWGDMPHNWASAECVRYLRHALVLEDGQKLRLLDGFAAEDARARKAFALTETPTRFGPISLEVEPVGARAWKVHFRRGEGSAPEAVELREDVFPGVGFGRISGAAVRKNESGVVEVDPAAREWTAWWGGR
ncbi:MAG: hypothetical protein ACRD3F_01475 [Acidobacteriaceae bacterium]